MSIKYYLTCLFLCFISVTISQNCNLKFQGIVKDFHDGAPIEGAYIKMEGSNIYAISDERGNFVFNNICTVSFKVSVSHVSCNTKTVTINLNKKSFIEIRLEHHIEELIEVNVTSKVNKKSKTAQESVIKSDVLERYSSLSLGDAIKEIPGISSINTGNSIVKPVINGLHSSRVLIMTNNVRLQDQEWGIEHAPNIDINSAESISLIKGANALEFGGDALGGVIIVNPSRTFNKDSIFGKTMLNGHSNGKGYGFNTTLTKTFSKGFYINGQVSHKQIGDYKTPDYFLTNTGSKKTGFSAFTGLKKLEYGFEVYYSYLKNKIAILRSSHIGNVEDLVNAINSDEPTIINGFSYDINAPKQEVIHQIFKANYYLRFKNFGKLDIQYDYQNNHRFEFDIRRGDDRDNAAIDLELQSHTFKSTLKLDSNSDNIYKIGLLAGYQDNYANPGTGVRRLIPDYQKFDFGIFSIGNFKPSEKLAIDIGVRYDFNRINAKKFYQTSRWIERGYNDDFSDIIIEDFGTQLLVKPSFDFHSVSVSTGLSYDLGKNRSVLFNYGLSNRAPNASELFSDGLHHSAARIELGDLRILKETSNRISGTYNYDSEKATITVEGFFNHIHNFIYLEPTGVETTIRGSFPVWEYKQVNAILFGADLNMRYEINRKFMVQNKSSFMKGEDVSSNRDLIDIPSLKTTNLVRFTNKKWSNFSAEIQSELVFRQRNFPNNNFEAYIPRTDSFILVDISSPPPAYHLFNVRSDFDLKISKKENVRVAFSINNLLNTSYRENLNRLRYFADEIGRNFSIQLIYNY